MNYLSNLSIRTKFLILPAIAATLMVALGAIFLQLLSSEKQILNRINEQDAVMMRELSRLFSEFSTNHIKFINLLATSLKSDIEEGEFYAAGRKNILRINKLIDALAELEVNYPLDENQQQIAATLREKLDTYHSQMGNTVLMASVELQLITQFMVKANAAYDAANSVFLQFIDAVQEDMRSTISDAQSNLSMSEYQYFLLLGATLIFIVLVSYLLSTVFATDLKSVIHLLSKLSQGDTDLDFQSRTRRDEFGAINQALEIFKQALIKRDELESNLKTEINVRKSAEQSMRISEERFRNLFEDNPLMLLTIDRHGRILSVNRRCETQLGYRQNQIIGVDIQRLVYPDDNNVVNDLIERCFGMPDARHQYTLRKQHRNGEVMWFRETAKLIEDENSIVVLLACEDITETRVLSEKLSYQATHDNLTGLVNRWEFENRLVRILEDAKLRGTEHVLCFLDLDQFKIINDTCGHSAGDELLKQLGVLLQKHIRSRDTLARLGGDEFGVLLEYCALSSGRRTARNLLNAIKEFRFAWGERQFRIGVSVGIIAIDETCDSIADLMAGADAACYAAKEQGRNRVHVYTSSDQQLAQRHGEMQWASRIPDALEKNKFELFYQVIYPMDGNAETGKSFEFLVRMRDDKSNEIITPAQFLPAAERYNFAERLDRWVVAHAFVVIRMLETKKFQFGSFGINLSGNSLGNEEFLDFVLSEMNRSQIRPESVCFEITETAAISNINSAQRFILRLKEEGAGFALDDFGTGLSSFAYLRELPVDYLKIDGLFVRDIAEDPIQYAMVKSINEIGHVLGMKTIAEFVETHAVMEKLAEIGVDYCQGYHIGSPRPINHLIDEASSDFVNPRKDIPETKSVWRRNT